MTQNAQAGQTRGPEGHAATQTRQHMQRDMVRGSLWTLGASLIYMPLSFLVNIVVVHSLGPSEYANFAVYVAVFAVAIPVANGGISETTMQWIATAHAQGNSAALLDVIRRCAGYHMLIQGPLMAVI